MPATLLGIFVGGSSSRMGGRPKGLLPVAAAGESIVGRLLRLASEASLSPVFVGNAEPYSVLFPQVPCVADQPAGIGPLGGLGGLLKLASDVAVLAVACDMPRLSPSLLARLANAPDAMVLAARADDGRWDPLCARYDAPQVLPVLEVGLASGVRSFQRLFELLNVTELLLSPAERAGLVDWDAPSDLTR